MPQGSWGVWRVSLGPLGVCPGSVFQVNAKKMLQTQPTLSERLWCPLAPKTPDLIGEQAKLARPSRGREFRERQSTLKCPVSLPCLQMAPRRWGALPTNLGSPHTHTHCSTYCAPATWLPALPFPQMSQDLRITEVTGRCGGNIPNGCPTAKGTPQSPAPCFWSPLLSFSPTQD